MPPRPRPGFWARVWASYRKVNWSVEIAAAVAEGLGLLAVSYAWSRWRGNKVEDKSGPVEPGEQDKRNWRRKTFKDLHPAPSQGMNGQVSRWMQRRGGEEEGGKSEEGQGALGSRTSSEFWEEYCS